LLNHTSGLPDYTADPELFAGILENRQWQPRELVALAEKQPQTFDPGSAWTYSSTNYIVAGLLVEAVTGRPLARELDRRIFAPLRLRHTSLPATARVSGYHAHGYITTELVPTADGQPLDVTGFNPSHAWAAGAIVSNAADLSTFFRALLSGRLLPPALLQEMKQTVAEDPTDPQKTFSYGLGLRRVADTCGANWGHTGTIFGYQSMAFGTSTQTAASSSRAPCSSLQLRPKLPSPRRQISPCAPTPTRRETPRLSASLVAVAAASSPVTRLSDGVTTRMRLRRNGEPVRSRNAAGDGEQVFGGSARLRRQPFAEGAPVVAGPVGRPAATRRSPRAVQPR
jgi:hypothetical protein